MIRAALLAGLACLAGCAAEPREAEVLSDQVLDLPAWSAATSISVSPLVVEVSPDLVDPQEFSRIAARFEERAVQLRLGERRSFRFGKLRDLVLHARLFTVAKQKSLSRAFDLEAHGELTVEGPEGPIWRAEVLVPQTYLQLAHEEWVDRMANAATNLGIWAAERVGRD